jgi:hypothetical protein
MDLQWSVKGKFVAKTFTGTVKHQALAGHADRSQRSVVEARLARLRLPAESPSRGRRGLGRHRRQTGSSGPAFWLFRTTQTMTMMSQMTAIGKSTIRPR